MRRFAFLLTVTGLIGLLAVPVYAAEEEDEVPIGTVETLLTATNGNGNLVGEMDLCDTVADAARAACGTDIAVVNGGDVIRNLDGGEVTRQDLVDLFLEDRELGTAEISGEDLLELLEYGVSYYVMDMSTETVDTEESLFDGFPQISGFTFTVDPTAPVGERIYSLKTSDGTEITADTRLTLTATVFMLEGGYGYPVLDYQSTDISLSEALEQHFDDGVLMSPETDRIRRLGVGETFSFSRPMILVICIALILLIVSVRGVRGGNNRERRFIYYDY